MTPTSLRSQHRRSLAALGAAFVLVLAACGTEDSSDASPSSTDSTPPTTTQVEALPEQVTTVLDALDTLEAEYTEPSKTDPGVSGAEEIYDLEIVGYSAGINVFATTEALDDWQSASDDLGGVSVTFDTTAVSLNSDEGKDASLALAPQLAEELGGVAHTGGQEPDYTPSVDEASAPTVVECLFGTPGPALWSDGTTAFSQECFDEATEGLDYVCPQTDHYVPDPSYCESNQPAHDGVAMADGGTCPAAICGYGHDAEGNRNPSSGEIQGRDGCQQGYIDDPGYCAAIEEVFEANIDWE
ncbi:MAG TPA: hypothetical protein H9870_08495 [Candidatus Corynebacterium avicola]|uniref:Uncharacterized protein n=1 Tax=Candidatus Corynebacterium avicola TaxID=2838527 RepID=A0A9D1RPC9_9CORY|nr:hypothetical protein [Candidatus Corynebacterium avicola]